MSETNHPQAEACGTHKTSSPWVLLVGALGVVFGDIGTSPLYAFKECFGSHDGHPRLIPNEGNVLGILSLIVWTLLVIVALKYVTFVMRANNKGEGGIMALLSLAFPNMDTTRKTEWILICVGLVGASLLFGDGVITPAISVLSAVEGLKQVNPNLEHYIIPITMCILVSLFAVQRFGTGKVGVVFGPVTALWFLVLAGLGISNLLVHPAVLHAFNPLMGVEFLKDHGFNGFALMGSVFLAVTGAEALYADMGHFGLRPIRQGWFWLVLPALLLNYLGQGALVLEHGTSIDNPFFELAPDWAQLPLVILATAATVIASQALISGTYSITMQAIQLGYLPRMQIEHTSDSEHGQIYLPAINWTLMLACLWLVVTFRTSTNLAAAYGIAVSLTMLVTTLLFYFVTTKLWKWPLWKSLLITLPFALVEIVFVAANGLKFFDGGWFPLAVGGVIFTLMTTWKRGRSILGAKLRESTLPLADFLSSDVSSGRISRVQGTAIFLSGNPGGTPLALLHNLKHNKVLHQKVIILNIITEVAPSVEPERRATFEDLGHGFYRVVGRYGYMEDPDVRDVLKVGCDTGFTCDPMQSTFFLSRETVVPSAIPGMALWREHLFAAMARNALPATAFFRLPPNRVIELGIQVEL